MKQRLLTLALLVGCIGLGIVGFFVNTTQDKKAPVITIEDKNKKITYKEGDDYEKLLEGVTAKDNRDGDVTKDIFIDSISTVSDGKSAVVRYAVIDSHNNVGVKTRVVAYEGTQGAENDVSKPDKAEEKLNQKAEENTKKQEESKETEKAKEEKKEEQTQEEVKETTQESEENQGELKPDGGNPAIRLKETSRTIKAGESFDVLSVVDKIVDDQDDMSSLSRRIHADGDYNVSVPGTYTIRYYVTDSSNNSSNVEEFTLVVK